MHVKLIDGHLAMESVHIDTKPGVAWREHHPPLCHERQRKSCPKKHDLDALIAPVFMQDDASRYAVRLGRHGSKLGPWAPQELAGTGKALPPPEIFKGTLYR